MLKGIKNKLSQCAIAMMLSLTSFGAFASKTANNPWEKTTFLIFDSLKGPMAYALIGIAVVGCGLTMAFLDLSGGAKKGVQVAFGASVAFGVTSIISTFFKFSGVCI